MDKEHWHRQTKDQPLYPDLIWSRPQNKRQAGKLLIVGGNVHSFAAAASAYSSSQAAGAGSVRVLLPDSLQKTVSKVFSPAEYAPSTPSGSFSRQGLNELLSASNWADGVLLAGDFGRNSETAVLLEQFTKHYKQQLTLTKDALDYFIKTPLSLLDRDQTLLVTSFAGLQKIASASRFAEAFTFNMDLLRLVDSLHKFSSRHQAAIIVKHLDNVLVSYRGKVSSTKLMEESAIWRVTTASAASVWWLQNPNKTFEALTTSIVSL